MRRGRHSATAEEQHLMVRLRSMVWGPAEFVGPPPFRMTAKGILAGCLAAVAIVGSTIAGAWYGIPGPAAGEGGLVCAALLVLYLCGVRAGRVLIGIIAVLAVRGGDLGRRRPGRRLGRRSLPLLGDRPGRRSREGPHLARV